jgi:hypothetical protein
LRGKLATLLRHAISLREIPISFSWWSSSVESAAAVFRRVITSKSICQGWSAMDKRLARLGREPMALVFGVFEVMFCPWFRGQALVKK